MDVPLRPQEARATDAGGRGARNTSAEGRGGDTHHVGLHDVGHLKEGFGERVCRGRQLSRVVSFQHQRVHLPGRCCPSIHEFPLPRDHHPPISNRQSPPPERGGTRAAWRSACERWVRTRRRNASTTRGPCDVITRSASARDSPPAIHAQTSSTQRHTTPHTSSGLSHNPTRERHQATPTQHKASAFLQC